jgi:hypothetical protein
MTDMPAFERDLHSKKDRTEPSLFQRLRVASAKSGRNAFEIAREFWRLHRGRGKLSIAEYCDYGLYDSERFSDEDKGRFPSESVHWNLTADCCDMSWRALTEDKWLSAFFLSGAGVRVPETLAILDRSLRTYVGVEKIATADHLKSFLTTQASLPMFGKHLRGIGSFGVFMITGADDEAIHLANEKPLGYEAFFEEFVGKHSYVLQRVVANHSFFEKYTPNTVTVRIVNILTDNGVVTPFALLKLPSRRNIADNFWREGNLICNLDVASGEILSAVAKTSGDAERLTDHPETGHRLIGEVLPLWPEITALNLRCATLFAPVRYQSLDIAISQDGPVVVEINTGSAFDLPQLASGVGFLTDEVTEFFRSCGSRYV